MDILNTNEEFVNIDPLGSNPAQIEENDTMTDTTTTTEPVTETKTNAMLDLIGKGQRVSVTEQIPHLQNLTFFSGMALVNGAEGKRGKLITEHGTLIGIIKTILDFSMGDYLPVVDQGGLLQLKTSFVSLASAKGDIENIGVVNAQYTGKYANRIVGLANVALAAEGADELDVAMAANAWYRLGWIGGQIKITKHLVNVDAKADESDEITHMRKQLFRALGARALLESEASGTPLVLKWNWNNATEVAYYVSQFALGTKERFENKRAHIAKQRVYKSDVRTSIAIEKIEEAGEVFTPKTMDLDVRKEDGSIVPEPVTNHIGDYFIRFLGTIKLGGVLQITEDNAKYTVECLRRNGGSVEFITK